MPRDLWLLQRGMCGFIAIAFAVSLDDGVLVGVQVEREGARAVLAKMRVGTGTASQPVQGLSLSGTLKRVSVGGSLAGTFRQYAIQIHIVLPESYLRREIATVESGTVTYDYGFRGGVLLNRVKASGPDMHFGGSWGPEQLDTEKTEFARFVLGCLGLDTPVMPLEFSVRPSGDGQRGTSTVLDVAGPRSFAAALHIDNHTHRPVMLSYMAPVRLPPATKAAGTAGPAGQAAGTISGPPAAEVRNVEIRFWDRRPVNGVYFPYRITKSAGNVTLEEIAFGKVVINPTIALEEFRNRVH